MFLQHEVSLAAGYDQACSRLIALVRGGGLGGLSDTAYVANGQPLMRVGPFGDRAGVSKLVRVHIATPVEGDGSLTVSLRWEATGWAGELFPVLDADLTLSSDGRSGSQLTLLGSYRPPFGPAGAVLDAAVLSRVADASVGAFLRGLAADLTAPQPNRLSPAQG